MVMTSSSDRYIRLNNEGLSVPGKIASLEPFSLEWSRLTGGKLTADVVERATMVPSSHPHQFLPVNVFKNVYGGNSSYLVFVCGQWCTYSIKNAGMESVASYHNMVLQDSENTVVLCYTIYNNRLVAGSMLSTKKKITYVPAQTDQPRHKNTDDYLSIYKSYVERDGHQDIRVSWYDILTSGHTDICFVYRTDHSVVVMVMCKPKKKRST
jgi:hypothetical protein